MGAWGSSDEDTAGANVSQYHSARTMAFDFSGVTGPDIETARDTSVHLPLKFLHVQRLVSSSSPRDELEWADADCAKVVRGLRSESDLPVLHTMRRKVNVAQCPRTAAAIDGALARVIAGLRTGGKSKGRSRQAWMDRHRNQELQGQPVWNGPARVPVASGPSSSSTQDSPLRSVVVEAGGVEILLPVGEGEPHGVLATYAQRVRDRGVFDGVQPSQALSRLSKVQARVVDEGADSRPKVAVITNHPGQLDPEHNLIRDVLSFLRARGVRPILVPPMMDLMLPEEVSRTERVAYYQSLAGTWDGVLGMGGDDVHPWLYGEPITYAVNPSYPRDQSEADIWRAVLGTGRSFVLGICRSHQFLQILNGGKAHQDVRREGMSVHSKDQLAHNIPLTQPAVDPDGHPHWVEFSPVSDFGRAAIAAQGGKILTATNSSRHQAVTPGESFTPAARFMDPQTGEQHLMGTSSWNVWTTQSHPEAQAKHHDASEMMMATLCARAKLMHVVKAMEAAGVPMDAQGLQEVLDRFPPREFSPADRAWAQESLLPRFAQG